MKRKLRRILLEMKELSPNKVDLLIELIEHLRDYYGEYEAEINEVLEEYRKTESY